MIQKRIFGTTDSGKEISLFTLTNPSGVSVQIINYGAIIVSVMIPDQHGVLADVVTGYDDLKSYIDDPFFFGGIVGRYANRICNGKFSIDSTAYQLTVNDGSNHLHGGTNGFIKKVWSIEKFVDGNAPSVTLSCCSIDGEEGYPGNVRLEVCYTLTIENELKIEYKGTTDKATLLNPTNHAYFNLGGSFDNTILDHELSIDADMYTPVGQNMIPTGEIASVSGTPLDFRKSVLIGSRIEEAFDQLKITKGYDHNWVLNNFTGKIRTAARLYHAKSKRMLEVLTDQPGLQFYSGNFLHSKFKGKAGKLYEYRTGLCLEAQVYPDAPNKPHFPSALLTPGNIYNQVTIYRFSVQ